jgi:hypothetical protein
VTFRDVMTVSGMTFKGQFDPAALLAALKTLV